MNQVIKNSAAKYANAKPRIPIFTLLLNLAVCKPRIVHPATRIEITNKGIQYLPSPEFPTPVIQFGIGKERGSGCNTRNCCNELKVRV